MNSSTTLLFCFALLLTFVSAAPVAIRDVYAPPITSPNSSAVWKMGSKQTVTWSTADAPQSITNPNGVVVLKKCDGLLDIKNPLAKGFNIMDGSVDITVPHVDACDHYEIVLFGDSGNNSEAFKIEA